MLAASLSKQNRFGIKKLFPIMYLQIALFSVAGWVLRSGFQARLRGESFVAIAMVLLALIPVSTLIVVRLRYVQMYAGTIAWSRRFDQKLLFYFVLPILVVVVAAMACFTPWLARISLADFWRKGQFQELTGLASAAAFMSLLVVLLSFAGLALTRRCPLGQTCRPS